MAAIEESVIEEPPKRGRGRPKGSLNKKTIATREAEASAAAEMRDVPPQNLTLDVSFEEANDDEIPQAPREPPKPPKKKVREPLPEPEPEPEPEPREDADDETVRPEYQIGSGSDDTEPEPPPPSPKKRAPRAKRQPKPKAPKPVRMTSPEPPSYLEVLKRGLDIAKHKQKAEKIERYDSFFRY